MGRADVSFIPVRDNSGSICCIFILGVDVTPRTRAERALTEREALFATAFNRSPSMQVILDAHGVVVDINTTAIESIACRREDVIGRIFWETAWWSPAEDTKAGCRELFMRALAGESVQAEVDYYFSPAGRGRVDTVFTPVRNNAGEVATIFAVGVDITYRAQVEKARADSEQRYRLQAELNPHILWTSWPDGRLDTINHSGLEYVGLGLERMREDGWRQLLHVDDRPALRQLWKRALETGEPLDVDCRIRRHDQQYRWHKVRAKCLRDPQGKIVQWFGCGFDIEDLQLARAAAEEANRAKSAFLSSMSHEIRTPMNAIIGMTSILRESRLEESQREAVEVIRGSGDHLLTVINDILDFSKIEAGRIQLERSVFAVRECIESALDLIAADAGGKGVEIGYLMHEGVPESVIGDIGRLRQVLLNLLSNAIKFTPKGGEVFVQLRASLAGPEAKDRYRLEFSVEDSGIGMDAGTIARLFHPFTQADSSTTRRFGGTGLGLSISKFLVQMMGGTIAVQSVPDKGSVFSFDVVADAGTLTTLQFVTQNVVELRGRRGLIVDDLEVNCRILVHYLRNWGMEPVVAADPADAISRIERGECFDIALLDYHMPQMDGLALGQALRARRSEAALPIMLLSSVMPDDMETSVFSSALLKPIKPARLLEALTRVFSTTAPRQEVAQSSFSLNSTLGREHPLRLLVVEDNAINQRVARMLLERMGYSADLAGDGAEALIAIARQSYDAVLMDVQMPVMDGLTATRELCRRYAPGERPRIIGMTANATQEDRRQCVRAGMDDYLSKPVQPEQLAAALQRTPLRQPSTDDYSPEGFAKLLRVYEAEGTHQIVEALLQDQPQQSQTLRRGADALEPVRIRAASHDLKTGARMAGADSLGLLFERIERLGADGRAAEAAELIPSALTRYEKLLQRLQREAEAAAGIMRQPP